MTAVLAPVLAALAALADRILRLIQRDPGRHFAPRRSTPGEFDYAGLPPLPVADYPYAPLDGERGPIWLSYTEHPADPEPVTGPLRLCAGRSPLDGWVADLVSETLDGLTARQWVDQHFKRAEHMVRTAALDAGQAIT